MTDFPKKFFLLVCICPNIKNVIKIQGYSNGRIRRRKRRSLVQGIIYYIWYLGLVSYNEPLANRLACGWNSNWSVLKGTGKNCTVEPLNSRMFGHLIIFYYCGVFYYCIVLAFYPLTNADKVEFQVHQFFQFSYNLLQPCFYSWIKWTFYFPKNFRGAGECLKFFLMHFWTFHGPTPEFSIFVDENFFREMFFFPEIFF